MDDIVLIVLGISALLALASLMLPIARRLSVPYTVLLALFGVVIGWISIQDFGYEGIIGDLFLSTTLLNLSSDAFLYVFLPPLLFSAGLNVQVRRLMDDVGAVIVLALIAVVVCTAMVGIAVNLVAPEYGLVAALLLGAIVATTDSAAVVAIFREIGAPKRLSIIVEGESLFNDAAAIAIFTVLLLVIEDPSQSILQTGLVKFAFGLVGGFLFGWLVARFFAAIIGMLRDVALTEITLTLCLAYVAYIVAERYVGVSGVIAVVTAAIVMSSEGRTRISPETWGSLKETWGLVDFIATSFIFVLAAMTAPKLITSFTLDSFYVVLTIFFAAMAARAVVLYGLMPALSRFNLAAPISGAYKTILVLGGLRGAVTVALALAINENTAMPPEVREFVLVSATGFVFLTLVVMAPSLRPIMKLIGLETLSASERILRDRVMSLAHQRVDTRARMVASDLGLSEDIGTLHELETVSPSVEPLDKGERGQFGLVSLASREYELYMTYFTNRIVDRRIADQLRAHTGRMTDAALTGGAKRYLEVAHEAVRINRRFRRALWFHRRLGYTGALSRVIADRLEQLIVTQIALKDMKTYMCPDIAMVIGEDAAKEIEHLIDERAAIVSGAIKLLDLQYPSYARMLRERYVKRVALGFEDLEYRQQLAQALIGLEVHEDLQQSRRRRLRKLETRPRLDLGLKLTEMLLNVPFLTELDRKALARLSRQLVPRLAVPGERIITKGEPGVAMYFIATGSVDVILRDRHVRLNSGDFFGEAALLYDAPRNADVISVGYCNLLKLYQRDFRRFLRHNRKFRTQIEAISSERLYDDDIT